MLVTTTEYCRHTGLGNKLFPWARAKVFCKQNHAVMLNQFWFSPRGAAVTRGGIDYSKVLNKIFLLNNFCNTSDELSYCKFLISKKINKVLVSDLNDATNFINQDDLLVTFRWNTSHNFIDLYPHHSIILESLNQIVKPIIKQRSINLNSDFIALNVRTGNDFISSDSSKRGYRKTSLDWFSHSLAQVRAILGNMPAYIVSDGGYKQLNSLLELENVHLVNNATAIEDLLFLSKAKILLGSGNSSFSAWASFLGQMPTYTSIETPFISFKLENVIEI